MSAPEVVFRSTLFLPNANTIQPGFKRFVYYNPRRFAYKLCCAVNESLVALMRRPASFGLTPCKLQHAIFLYFMLRYLHQIHSCCK